MIKIIMSSGEVYNFKKSEIESFMNDFILSSNDLPNKMTYLNNNVYINLSQITSLEDKTYIEDSDIIVP